MAISAPDDAVNAADGVVRVLLGLGHLLLSRICCRATDKPCPLPLNDGRAEMQGQEFIYNTGYSREKAHPDWVAGQQWAGGFHQGLEKGKGMSYESNYHHPDWGFTIPTY